LCLFDEVDALSRQTQHIFEQIFIARNELGVSYADLQDTTGLSAGDLQAIIAGRTPPIDWTSVKSTVRLTSTQPSAMAGQTQLKGKCQREGCPEMGRRASVGWDTGCSPASDHKRTASDIPLHSRTE
jgi:hypothetical protein